MLLTYPRPDYDLELIFLQIRRQARLRREFLYRKGVEERQKAIQDKKDRLKKALDGNFSIFVILT